METPSPTRSTLVAMMLVSDIEDWRWLLRNTPIRDSNRDAGLTLFKRI